MFVYSLVSFEEKWSCSNRIYSKAIIKVWISPTMTTNTCQHSNADIGRYTTLEQEEDVGDMVVRPTTVVVVVDVLVNVSVTSSEVEVELVNSLVAIDVLLVSLVMVRAPSEECG